MRGFLFQLDEPIFLSDSESSKAYLKVGNPEDDMAPMFYARSFPKKGLRQ